MARLVHKAQGRHVRRAVRIHKGAVRHHDGAVRHPAGRPVDRQGAVLAGHRVPGRADRRAACVRPRRHPAAVGRVRPAVRQRVPVRYARRAVRALHDRAPPDRAKAFVEQHRHRPPDDRDVHVPGVPAVRVRGRRHRADRLHPGAGRRARHPGRQVVQRVFPDRRGTMIHSYISHIEEVLWQFRILT